MKSLLGIISSIILLTIAMVVIEYYVYYVPLLNAMPNTEDFEQSINWTRVIIQVSALLVGIFTSHMVNRLKKLSESGDTEVNIFSEFKNMFKAVDFYIALFSSPLIFSIVIVATNGAPLLMSTVFAFQNGFFWKTVIPNKPKPINP